MSEARRADIAYWTGLIFGLIFVFIGGPLARRLEMVHFNDFSGVWSGPSTFLLGISPWDPARYSDVAVSLGTKTPDALVYDHMPWTIFETFMPSLHRTHLARPRAWLTVC